MDIATAIQTLTDLGILPAIVVLAGLRIAKAVWSRFAR